MSDAPPAIGFGKVILLGEHAVVHGHAALAGAIDRCVRIRAVPPPATRAALLDLRAWDLRVGDDDDHPVTRAIRAIAGAIDGAASGPPPWRFEGDADLPVAAGLGSSAALSVAVTRALCDAAALRLDDARVMEIATAGEQQFHGNPSGVDVALATRGGLGLFRRGYGLSPLDAPPLSIVVGLSGEPRATKVMVERVAAALESDSAANGARLGALGTAALRGAWLVEHPTEAALRELGELMTSAHRNLAALGVSTPTLDGMVKGALAAGALGAKLTGAGGGGAVIALAPGHEDAVIAEWRAHGKVAFACCVGACHPGARP